MQKLTDRDYYRHDRQIFVNESCQVLDELPGDIVTINADCTISILMMCNGVSNCEHCVDEIYSNCMQFDCGEGTYLYWAL